jgi:PAS domain-containing protein
MNKRQFPHLSKSFNRGAFQIVLLYLLVGGLWILLSDKAAARIALNQEMLTVISLYKGWGYVLVTALLLYWLIQRDTAALRASEAQLQQVIDALPVLIAYVDRGGRYRFTNRTYEEWFGGPAQGKTLEEVTGPKAYQTISPYVDQALRGETVTYESALSYPLGERFINATYIPDKTTDGRVKGFYDGKQTNPGGAAAVGRCVQWLCPWHRHRRSNNQQDCGLQCRFCKSA